MSRWATAHSAALARAPLVALNFHRVTDDAWADLEAILLRAIRLGPALDLDEMPGNQPPGPRLFVAFYDGYRETGLAGAELCERLGIRAYFFPVFTSGDPERGQLSDDDLRSIAGVHEVGFHSSSHLAANEVTAENLDLEVLGPMRHLREITGRTPRLGAWRGGARYDERLLANLAVRDLGLRFLVSNWSLEAIPGADRGEPQA